jgi:hypothetical protein
MASVHTDDNGNDDDNTKETSFSIMTFDLGENATAYCKGTCTNTDARLRCTIDGVGVATLGVIASAKDAVVAIHTLFKRLPVVDIYVIEEQPAINKKTRMLEAALAMKAMCTNGAIVVHAPTSRLTNMFQLPSGHGQRKAESVKCAKKVLGSSKFLVDKDVFAVLSTIKRKHDIADAILYYAWFVTTGLKELEAQVRKNPRVKVFRATAGSNSTAEKRREKIKAKRLVTKAASVIGNKKRVSGKKRDATGVPSAPPKKKRKVMPTKSCT